MIDWEQEVEIKWNNNIKKYYVDLGYLYTKKGESFFVKAKDLKKSSTQKIEAECDYCHCKYMIKVLDYNKHSSEDNKKDCCSKCRMLKIKETLDMNKCKRANKAFKNLTEFMDKKNYQLLTKESEYSDIHMDINYICPIHGKRTQTLANLLSGKGCLKCADEKHGDNNRNSINDIVELIERQNNNTLLNPEDYKNYKENNLRIKCACGREYRVSVQTYINGKNQCNICNKSESRGEQKIRQWLENNNIDYIPEYIFDECKDIKHLRFDFYIPSQNKIIEFDGRQHFYPWDSNDNFEKIKYHDNIKNKFCYDNKIKLIRIPYTKYKQINEILDKELKIM